MLRHPFVRQLQARIVALTLVMAVAVSAALLPTIANGQGGPTKLVLLHTSDYHSHAIPKYAEGQQNVGGLARVIQYLRDEKQANANAVILSGGDTMNLGTPSWSDKYQCAEWPLFNGLQDAIAFGNHELDYGWQRFEACKASAEYPVLNANFVDAAGQPILQPWMVIERGGVKLGLFSLAGDDFEKLVKPADRPEGAKFLPADQLAPQIVKHLREVEKVDVVIEIGHRLYEEDVKMAQAVPGIDIILGTHSHRKEELKQIPGTSTWIISPFQYFNYVSRLELSFDGHTFQGVTGGLVQMSADRPEAADIAERVAGMQKELEADPKFAAKFVKLGEAANELSDENISSGESVLGNWVQDTVRAAGKAHVALSTASSFRATIPPGPVTVEDYLTAVPYKNLVLVHEMSGAQVQQILDLSASRRGSDGFSQASGVRYTIKDGKATDVQILSDPAASTTDMTAFVPLDPAATYLVATTDFQAKIAPGYSDLFKQAASVTDTGLIVNDLMMETLKSAGSVSAQLDGRVK